MEPNLEKINLASKKMMAQKKRKKELYHYFSILIFTNLMSVFLTGSSPESEPKKMIYHSPKGHESVQISANMLVPFESFKKVKVLSYADTLICKEVVLLERKDNTEDAGDFLGLKKGQTFHIEAPSSCLKKLLGSTKLKIVPLSYKEEIVSKRNAYEIVY